MIKRIKNWLNAEDVSNQMGGGCLVSAMRWMAVVAIIFVIMIIILKTR